MENKDTQKFPKTRRPLPTPTPSPKPSSPVMPTSVTPSSFYASSSTQRPPPPLPTRPKNIGSGHTTYLAPPTQPMYGSADTSSYREPELVTEEFITTDDTVPDLIPNDSGAWYKGQMNWEPTEDWSRVSPSYSSHKDWDNNVENSNWLPFDGVNHTLTSYTSRIVIDGRDEYEEVNWWDAAVRERADRPGSGMLPPVLAEALHNSEHSLFYVSVTPPDIKLPEPGATGHASTASIDGRQSPSVSITNVSTSSHLSAPPPPPTADDVRTAVPHPHAYYCPKENGWVLLIWKQSSVSPPLAKSFLKSSHQPLPDQNRRKRTGSCVGQGEQPFGQVNKTHHFHMYQKAIDACKLNPPFCRREWEKVEKVKQKRRAMAIDMDELNMEKIQAFSDDYKMQEGMPQEEEEEEEEEGDLLDLYVCCQCSVYCVASGIIPGVIPRKVHEEFTRDKREHPTVGRSGEMAIMVGWQTVVKIIENKLWKGENRVLPVTRQAFQNKMGWNANVGEVFEVLGFTQKMLPSNKTSREEEVALQPPTTDIVSSQGRKNRAKLLRAWVELSSWMSEYQRIYASHLKTLSPFKLWVKVESAREMYQMAIGAHPDQIPRGLLPAPLMNYKPLERAWQSLGLTPMSYSWDLLAFAYMAQCRCDPAYTMEYFTHFYLIVKTMQEVDPNHTTQELQNIIIEERARDRYTYEDLENATKTLGFGKQGNLGVDFENDIDEEFIVNAWRDCVKRAWRDPENGSQLQREANDAFRITAEARRSVKLRKLWEAEKGKTMTPDRAYDTLEIPKDTDDAMLVMVFGLRIEEQPSQIDKMREALSIIAEVRDSERLRQFLETGQDPGVVVAPTPMELPRGLNQLGNTCYLNSLLQYFYTIKELREAVAPMASLDLKSLEDDKLTDDDLKRHRVGGRLVTRREIVRSKKFINQLADLFWQLEYCSTAAVTPTIELAKLALVTSRDEEEDEADKGGTDSSNDTDATLVDDGPSRFPVSDQIPQSPGSPPRSFGSILGKRPRDIEGQRSEMEIDSPVESRDGFVVVQTPRLSPPLMGEASSSKSPEVTNPGDDIDVDMEMQTQGSPRDPPDQKPPPPTRKATQISDSAMMFGKQHDVAECMDNCMFQIETALLKFNEMSGSHDDNKTSIVKRLFYGKIRQRLAVAPDNNTSRSSVHEKEDLFSHLPVNVTQDGVDLYDGLSRYFDDVVEFEGKKAQMEVSLIDLPPLLQIQLQRVQFNRETLQPYKSQAYVKFGETIYMDRFLESADPHKKAHSKAVQIALNDCRERIRLLTQGTSPPSMVALQHTHDFISKQDIMVLPDVDEDLIACLKEEQDLLKVEIEQLGLHAEMLKADLEAIWKDDLEAAYELTSVFIHRGSSPSWGHYFFYSRHLPEEPESWFKYNDSDVTVVSKDEVLADTTGLTANPYLLVFARKGSEKIDTVQRFDPASLEADI